jgi:hypothetical protein
MGVFLTVRVARETVVINWGAARRFLPARWRARFGTEEESAGAP